MSTAGYSGTPLAAKLGIKPACRVVTIGAPPDYARLLEPLPGDVRIERRVSARTDIVHLFVTRREDLSRRLAALRETIRADAAVWVSWPKKTSGVASTVGEQTIRDLALPLGFVDVKVCAVDATWSGLKLVIRKELR